MPDYLGKQLGYPDAAAALYYCFGRTPEQVTERADKLGDTGYADYLRRRASEIGLA